MISPSPRAAKVQKTVAFADLDDTLFQTLRKLPGVDVGTLTPATVSTQGVPHSFCTPAQAALLGLLEAAEVIVIPVTGRDEAAMERVTLPFSSWRVVNHGLTILTPGGEVDPEWAARVRAHLKPLQAPLSDLTERLRAEAEALGCRLTIHHAQGLPFMTVLKHPGADPQPLAQLQTRWEGWLGGVPSLQVIANANNVSVLPRHLGKAEAVRHLRGRHFPHATLTLALGDSLSDLAFMNACDLAITPPGGQLLRTLTAAKLPQR